MKVGYRRKPKTKVGYKAKPKTKVGVRKKKTYKPRAPKYLKSYKA